MRKYFFSRRGIIVTYRREESLPYAIKSNKYILGHILINIKKL